MNMQKIQECERTKIEKWSRFQFANSWKKFAILFSLVVFGILITLKFTENKPEWAVEGLKRALLVGLLVISLSKEKIEDEMVNSLRAKSYTLSFILGVLYTLIQPLAEIIVDGFLIEKNPDNTFSYFDVLFYMLMIQILFFEVLKRYR